MKKVKNIKEEVKKVEEKKVETFKRAYRQANLLLHN
jgi:chromosomal replication initiation ATPase DnaA